MSRVVRVRRKSVRGRNPRDEVDPEDPIFHLFPLTRKRIRLKDASENLDGYLYGRES